ncbi:MAG TPA: hypothetical protein VJR29_04855 [bacterium]|nr:hypothetical protein [bacterium]
MESFRRFEARGGDAMARELRSLAAETDPELYFAGLNHLARRLASRDRFVEAGELWSFVAEQGASSAPALAQRARAELEVLSGGGAFGRRVEFLAQRFVGEATSPAALAGMTAAGLAYNVGRSALLGRLLASEAGLLTRGWGARGLAGLGGFAVEAPAFTLTTRALHAASGHGSPNSWGHDLAASYLTLGGLKFFSGAGAIAAQRLGAGPLTRALVPTAGAYLGILAGHGLERAAGLRPAQPTDQVLFDSLAMLLQFQVGGRLSGEILGPRFAAWQREVQVRSDAALAAPSFRRPPGAGFAFGGLEPSFATVGGGTALSPESPLRSQPMMMVAKRPGSESPYADASPMPIPRERGSGPRAAEKTVMRRLEDLQTAQRTLEVRGEYLSLWQILQRAIDQERIPADLDQELSWAVRSFDLYRSSPILRRQVRKSDYSSTESLIRRLDELRPAIQSEQRIKRYALATLVQALVYGGRIPHERLRSLTQAAGSFDLFSAHPFLRRMRKRDLADPYRFVQALRPLRYRVEELAQDRYKLSTLTDAMQWHPHFPKAQLQSYSMVAGANDFVGALPLGRLRLDIPELRELSLEQVYLRLLHLKPALIGGNGEPVTIGYILSGLRCHGLDRVRDLKVNDSAIQNAYVIDFVQDRWKAWGEHFHNLSLIPKHLEGDDVVAGWRRPAYAKAHLLKENGEPYSDSRLSNFVRWGVFLWEHREALSLGRPDRVEVREAPSEGNSALREFLSPYWDRLRKKEPEDFLQSMLELRQKFRETHAEFPSLPAMVSSFYRAHRQGDPGSVLNYAQQVDGILRRWHDWADHFQRIASLPRWKRSPEPNRSRYAAENLKRENGESFSQSTLNGLVRWGVWLWENRQRIGMSRGTTIAPPRPPADGNSSSSE